MSFVLLESYVAFWSRLIIILLRVYIALQMTRHTALFIQLSYYAFLYFEQQLKFPLKILSTKNKYFHMQFKSKKVPSRKLLLIFSYKFLFILMIGSMQVLSIFCDQCMEISHLLFSTHGNNISIHVVSLQIFS